MNRINKIISTAIIICFVFNTTCSDYALALSPTIVSSKLGEETRPGTRDGIYALGQRLVAAKIGPGSIDFNIKPEKFITSGVEYQSLPKGVKFVKADYANPPAGWSNNTLLQETDLISALKHFRNVEAQMTEEDLEIREGYFEVNEESGELPIARIEKIAGDRFVLVVHTKFVQMWNHIRQNDIWFEFESRKERGKKEKRTASVAWGIFYRLAKHEMIDLTKIGLESTKGGGHISYDAFNLSEEKANDIGGRYSPENNAIWLWFLGSYSFANSTRYNNRTFTKRLNWLFSDDSDALKIGIRGEFPKKLTIANMLAGNINYQFFSRPNIEVPVLKVDEKFIKDYEARKKYILDIFPATGLGKLFGRKSETAPAQAIAQPVKTTSVPQLIIMHESCMPYKEGHDGRTLMTPAFIFNGKLYVWKKTTFYGATSVSYNDTYDDMFRSLQEAGLFPPANDIKVYVAGISCQVTLQDLTKDRKYCQELGITAETEQQIYELSSAVLDSGKDNAGLRAAEEDKASARALASAGKLLAYLNKCASVRAKKIYGYLKNFVETNNCFGLTPDEETKGKITDVLFKIYLKQIGEDEALAAFAGIGINDQELVKALLEKINEARPGILAAANAVPPVARMHGSAKHGSNVAKQPAKSVSIVAQPAPVAKPAKSGGWLSGLFKHGQKNASGPIKVALAAAPKDQGMVSIVEYIPYEHGQIKFETPVFSFDGKFYGWQPAMDMNNNKTYDGDYNNMLNALQSKGLLIPGFQVKTYALTHDAAIRLEDMTKDKEFTGRFRFPEKGAEEFGILIFELNAREKAENFKEYINELAEFFSSSGISGMRLYFRQVVETNPKFWTNADNREEKILDETVETLVSIWKGDIANIETARAELLKLGLKSEGGYFEVLMNAANPKLMATATANATTPEAAPTTPETAATAPSAPVEAASTGTGANVTTQPTPGPVTEPIVTGPDTTAPSDQAKPVDGRGRVKIVLTKKDAAEQPPAVIEQPQESVGGGTEAKQTAVAENPGASGADAYVPETAQPPVTSAGVGPADMANLQTRARELFYTQPAATASAPAPVVEPSPANEPAKQPDAEQEIVAARNLEAAAAKTSKQPADTQSPAATQSGPKTGAEVELKLPQWFVEQQNAAGAKVGSPTKPGKSPEDAKMVLVLSDLVDKDYFTIKNYMESYEFLALDLGFERNISESTARRDLYALVKQGILEIVNEGEGTIPYKFKIEGELSRRIKLLKQPISELPMPEGRVRAQILKGLNMGNVFTIADVLSWNEGHYSRFIGLGKDSLSMLREALHNIGVRLPGLSFNSRIKLDDAKREYYNMPDTNRHSERSDSMELLLLGDQPFAENLWLIDYSKVPAVEVEKNGVPAMMDWVINIGIGKGPGAIPELISEEKLAIWKSAELLRADKMRVLIPRHFSGREGTAKQFVLTNPVKRTIEDMKKKVTDNGGFLDVEGYCADDVTSVLQQEPDTKKILVVNNRTVPEVERLLRKDPKIFKNVRLYYMDLPEDYSEMHENGQSICQIKAITIAILMRLYNEGDENTGAVLGAMLKGSLPDGITVYEFIKNIPEKEGEDKNPDAARLQKFITWKVRLVEFVGKQLRILQEFVWSAA